MPPLTGPRLEFRFSSLDAMSEFLRRLRMQDRGGALAEAAKAHFGSFTVTVTLFRTGKYDDVRNEAAALGGTELVR